MEALLNEIKESYELGITYFEGELNGEEFKIRMNKNHGRNAKRNDDFSIHNLSLVNVKDFSLQSNYVKNKKVQQQQDNIMCWGDALMIIEDFFYNIENAW